MRQVELVQFNLHLDIKAAAPNYLLYHVAEEGNGGIYFFTVIRRYGSGGNLNGYFTFSGFAGYGDH